MNSLSDRFNQIYRDQSSDCIPWNALDLPIPIKKLVESKCIPPCRTIDIGCGLGNYCRELAKMGFEITGVDFSRIAIEKAKQMAIDEELCINFMVADFSQELDLGLPPFDFAFDYGLLHHIFPDHRKVYMHNVARHLKPNAYYLSIAFSEDDEYFEGKEKYRKTPLGSVLYFSSKREIEKLVSPLFHILELKDITIPGKNGNHRAYFAFMQKKVS